MRYPLIEQLFEAEAGGRAALLLPVGTVQPHGSHNPVGTDLLISERMCFDACRALAQQGIQAAILPALPYGATRYFDEFPGCFPCRPSTLHASIVDICGELARQGVHRLALVNNNYTPEHMSAIYSAIAEARQRLGVRVHYMDITHPHQERRPQIPQAYVEGDFHGGQYETSLMLASNSSLVDEGRRVALPSVSIDLVAAIQGGINSTVPLQLNDAYIGHPAKASASQGQQTYKVLCEMLQHTIRRMLAGEDPPEPGWYARQSDRQATAPEDQR
jgi:creatinine amidohydrolase